MTDFQEGQAIEASFDINPLQLQEEFMKLPAKLAFYNAQHASIAKAEAIAKSGVARLEADLYVEHRHQLELDPSISRVTEKMIESAVARDERLLVSQNDLYELRRQKNVISGYCEALRAKKDMLIQLGAHVRAEMERDPSLRQTSSQSASEALG